MGIRRNFQDPKYRQALWNDTFHWVRRLYLPYIRKIHRLYLRHKGLYPKDDKMTFDQAMRLYNLGDMNKHFPEDDLREYGIYCWNISTDQKQKFVKLVKKFPEIRKLHSEKYNRYLDQYWEERYYADVVQACLCEPGQTVDCGNIPFIPGKRDDYDISVLALWLKDEAGNPLTGEKLAQCVENLSKLLPSKTIGGLPIHIDNVILNVTGLHDIDFWMCVWEATEALGVQMKYWRTNVYCHIETNYFYIIQNEPGTMTFRTWAPDRGYLELDEMDDFMKKVQPVVIAVMNSSSYDTH